jgi:hypothetical protein
MIPTQPEKIMKEEPSTDENSAILMRAARKKR